MSWTSSVSLETNIYNSNLYVNYFKILGALSLFLFWEQLLLFSCTSETSEKRHMLQRASQMWNWFTNWSYFNPCLSGTRFMSGLLSAGIPISTVLYLYLRGLRSQSWGCGWCWFVFVGLFFLCLIWNFLHCFIFKHMCSAGWTRICYVEHTVIFYLCFLSAGIIGINHLTGLKIGVPRKK